jgi:hypothetical protein
MKNCTRNEVLRRDKDERNNIKNDKKKANCVGHILLSKTRY